MDVTQVREEGGLRALDENFCEKLNFKLVYSFLCVPSMIVVMSPFLEVSLLSEWRENVSDFYT